jgi:hypothetical protein
MVHLDQQCGAALEKQVAAVVFHQQVVAEFHLGQQALESLLINYELQQMVLLQ